MFDRVLVPLDGSSLAERALPYAGRIATASRGKLILVEAAEARGFPGADATRKIVATVGAAETYVQQHAHRLRAQGFDAEPHVYYDDPAPGIRRAIEDQKADLVVMSTHGRSGLPRVVYGSVAEAVLQHSQVPVLLIPLQCDEAWSDGLPFRIVLPLDGSTLSEDAIPIAAHLARTLSANLVLLQVVEPPVAYEAGYAVTFDLEASQSEARHYLAGILELPPLHGLGAERVVVAGQAAAMICMEAHNEHAAAVVMASHGRGGFERLVLGSVATAVLHGSRRPLLVVPASNARPHPAVDTEAMSAATRHHPQLIDDIPSATVCAKCGEHQATERFAESMLAANHDMYELWCACCVVKEQLKGAREQAERIPDLERRLAATRCRPVDVESSTPPVP